MSDEIDLTESETPAQIGPFSILRRIGSGGMGTVYLGRHQETGQEAAVKLLPPALARDTGFRLRFRREIEALERLHNPHIVEFQSSGEDLGSVYYAMEYVAGETLTQRLQRERRLPWQAAIEIAAQLCQALKAAHDAGVIHRDLKPSNILISTQEVVKLTDFGIAQVFASDKLTLTGGVVGTAEYMSPEQAQGQRASKRSDLYSLGAVLYVILTGRPPFVGQTSVDILQKHRYGQFDLPSRYVPEIPPQLDDIVKQLLEKDPEKRVPDAFVLSRRLKDVLRQHSQRVQEMPTTSAGTVVAGNAADHDGGPGEATIVRDLVRSEVTRNTVPRGFSQWLDNVYVLGTLLLLVMGGIWWMASGRSSPESRFAAGVALMQQEPGEAWLRARDEHFQPLQAADASVWESRTAPYLAQIEAYELEQSLLSPRRRNRMRASPPEIEVQLRQVARLWNDGELPAAVARLKHIESLWSTDPTVSEYLGIVAKWQQDLTAQLEGLPDPVPTLEAALQRAAKLEATDSEAARKLYAAIFELYAHDPRAVTQRNLARQALTEEAHHERTGQ